MSQDVRAITAAALTIMMVVGGWSLSYGDTLNSDENPHTNARYQIIGLQGYAVLLDTRTGCVWSATTKQITGPLGTAMWLDQFRLVSVEGLYHLSQNVEELSKTPRVPPAKCVQ